MNEILLDNHPWPEMQDAMAAFDWPVSEKRYDVRQFLVRCVCLGGVRVVTILTGGKR